MSTHLRVLHDVSRELQHRASHNHYFNRLDPICYMASTGFQPGLNVCLYMDSPGTENIVIALLFAGDRHMASSIPPVLHYISTAAIL